MPALVPSSPSMVVVDIFSTDDAVSDPPVVVLRAASSWPVPWTPAESPRGPRCRCAWPVPAVRRTTRRSLTVWSSFSTAIITRLPFLHPIARKSPAGEYRMHDAPMPRRGSPLSLCCLARPRLLFSPAESVVQRGHIGMNRAAMALQKQSRC